jgi:hypothetical protein
MLNADQTYRDLYKKTTEQIVELMIATGINPEDNYDDHAFATLFDMGALHLLTRLDGPDFSKVMNRIGDIAVEKSDNEAGEVPFWSYDRPADSAVELAAETGISYDAALAISNMD